ncbi:hypothetical protein DPEC_G00016530 [Dallia pectoralis]|uniref:Uncharacterized protein n=1 Tax=Dallia pectoralis TaxID=75939 RepID=A0ACC2HMN2_DALPE|nr:hypothetical protein DPEC_G00016530 [Dallia pectoralis]
MPCVTRATSDGTCQALCRTQLTQNSSQRNAADISKSVLSTSLMGLLLVADRECFLNAVVQCLSHTRAFRDYCLVKAYRQEMCSREQPELMEVSRMPRNICVSYWTGCTVRSTGGPVHPTPASSQNPDMPKSDLFSGLLCSSLHCSVCSFYCTCFDVFSDLSLPIHKRSAAGSVSLRECLDLFSQEEKLDEENAPVKQPLPNASDCV